MQKKFLTLYVVFCFLDPWNKTEVFNYEGFFFFFLLLSNFWFHFKSLPYPRLWKCMLMISSKSFIRFALKFRSLVHFDLIFICAVKLGSNLILLHVDILLFQHHHEDHFLPLNCFNALFNIQLTINVRIISVFSAYSYFILFHIIANLFS